MYLALKENSYHALLWGFVVSLALVLLFPIEKLVLLTPLAYFLFAAVFVWKHKEIQKRKILILWAIAYIIIGLLDGAFLSFFWRSVVLLILPILFGLQQRSWLYEKREIAAFALLFIAPLVLLFAGFLHLEDIHPASVFLLIGTLAGFGGFYLVTANRMRLLPLIALVAIAMIGIAMGIPNAMAYSGSHSTATKTPLAQGTFVDAAGKQFSISDFKGKIVVLDFWFKGCSICFEEFPQFQKLVNTHKGDNAVFATVGVPMEDDTANKIQNLELLQKYSFPKWALKQGTIEQISPYIDGYPVFMVFDKQGQLRYNGGLYMGRQYLVNNIEDLLAKLEQEH